MSTDPRPQGQDTGMPTCYRHPGRETYVRCQRCDRPICPDCMRDAAVGHQCPQCVNEGSRGARQGRTVFGGQVVNKPYVTWALIAVNVVVFIVQSLASNVEGRYGLWPPMVADGQYARLITSAFLHYGPMHLLFNMWALYVVGRSLEMWLGRTRFIALYVLGALGGSVLEYLIAPLNTNAAGASGAIFGLFAAIFVMAKRLRFDPRGIVVLIVLNLAITFVFPGIAWQAHVGGLVTGAALAAAFAYAPPRSRLMIQAGSVVCVAALFAVLVIVRTNQLTAQLTAQLGLG